jgi:hypothetical protein
VASALVVATVLAVTLAWTFSLTPARASAGFVQANTGDAAPGSSTVSVSLSSPLAAGDLLVVYVLWDSGTATVSDTLGDTFAAPMGPTSWRSGARLAEGFYASGTGAGADTVSVALSSPVSTHGIVYAAEYAGIVASAPLDGTAAAVGSGAEMNSGDVTTTNADDLLVGLGVSSDTVTSPGPGFTTRAITFGNIVEDETVSTTGAYAATATQNSSAWEMQLMAFQELPAGPASTTTSIGGPTSTGPTSTTSGGSTTTQSTTGESTTTQSTTGGQPPPPSGTCQAYPASNVSNGRYLLDADGNPFLIVGDSPQNTFANLSTAEAQTYFADRHALGFNAAWVDILVGTDVNGRADGSTYDGILPFTTPGDFSTPNPAYFQRVDQMVSIAAANNITLFVNPVDTSGPGWLSTLEANGTTKDYNFGAFLGNRYKGDPNIVWLNGNDFQTWSTSPSDDADAVAVANGIKSADPNHLQTIELNYDHSTSLDDPNWRSIVGLNAAYTYLPTYDEVLHGYNQAPTKPVFMVEANYEFENNTGTGPGTPFLLREQEYWTMTSGATGQLYGSLYTVHAPDWATELANLDTPGAVQVGYMGAFFRSLPWWNLVPDQAHAFLTAGYGTYNLSGTLASNTYATAALTPDGRTGVIYAPQSTTLSVNLGAMCGPSVTAQWYDPTTGTYRAAGSFSPSGTQRFTSPPSHADGADDWVLLLQG